jgi:hypothetical protein
MFCHSVIYKNQIRTLNTPQHTHGTHHALPKLTQARSECGL